VGVRAYVTIEWEPQAKHTVGVEKDLALPLYEDRNCKVPTHALFLLGVDYKGASFGYGIA